MVKYWYLLTRDNYNALWCVEFGSYTKSEVVFERLCYRGTHRASDLKIVCCGDTQSDIEALRARLNYGEYI